MTKKTNPELVDEAIARAKADPNCGRVTKEHLDKSQRFVETVSKELSREADKPEKACAFCDKKLSEVEQLVERRKDGPAICNECIALSLDMLLKQLTRVVRGSNQAKKDLEAARAEAEKMERVRKWWSDHVREMWAEPDGSDSGHIHTSKEGIVLIQELVGVLKARSDTE